MINYMLVKGIITIPKYLEASDSKNINRILKVLCLSAFFFCPVIFFNITYCLKITFRL